MIFIALGGNIPSHAGAPLETLRAALLYLSARDVRIAAVSSFYRTPAWPDPSDPEFVNAVARIETGLTPQALLELLHQTETAFGRIRSTRNAPRTLDLDLIDFDGRCEAGPPALPHPRLSQRAFVLLPLCDIAPDWRHPVTGEPIADLIAALPAADRRIARLDS